MHIFRRIDNASITRYNAAIGTWKEGRDRAVVSKPLNEYREERYLTVDEFAELLGVTPQTLYRITRGETRPRPTTIRKIAKSLGVHPTEIAEFVRKPSSNGQGPASGVNTNTGA